MSPNISYLTAIAAAGATSCFTLTIAHFTLWFRGLSPREHALCAVMTLSAGFVILLELGLTLSTDISNAEIFLRLLHLAMFATVMSLLAFVYFYLDKGQLPLIWTIGLLWSVTIITDMSMSGSILRTQIGELRMYATPWGEPYTIAIDQASAWKYLTDIASVLICVFLLRAALSAWRDGRRHRAVLVGGSSFAFIVIAGALIPLQDAGIIKIPLIASAALLAIVLFLAYQLIDEAFRAKMSQLEVDQLRRAMMLGEMVGGLAHEINQPLAAILSNAQAASRFLKADNVDLGEIREIVDDIIVDEKRASGIIRGLRQLIEREETDIASADINAVARSAAKIMSGELHTHGVVLRTDLQPDIGPARANPVQIEQVLINLLFNAVHAVANQPAERRRVAIRTSKSERAVEVAVIDRGTGIGEEQKALLFKPFVSMSEGGLGVGLTICKRIVERFDGKIWVEDREGGGTIFRFTLPLAKSGS